jgi:uncharacterized Zn finger protein
MGYRYWDYYPRATPNPVAKAGKARKKFGITWWGKKWVSLLDDNNFETRMARGRAYARAEMVKKFKIKENIIEAKVKGSSGYYTVSIDFNKFSEEDWKIISEKLTCLPIIMSHLLNNEMPENIDEITGYNFVPKTFSAQCSCPDFANPCKHIAAVFYTIADEIDYDPFILFELRGKSKKKVLEEMGIIEEEKPVQDESDNDMMISKPSLNLNLADNKAEGKVKKKKKSKKKVLEKKNVADKKVKKKADGKVKKKKKSKKKVLEKKNVADKKVKKKSDGKVKKKKKSKKKILEKEKVADKKVKKKAEKKAEKKVKKKEKSKV